jgi:hypothetical protein
VEDLSEVQVDPEADGDEIGEQQDEPKPVVEAVLRIRIRIGKLCKNNKQKIFSSLSRRFQYLSMSVL